MFKRKKKSKQRSLHRKASELCEIKEGEMLVEIKFTDSDGKAYGHRIELREVARTRPAKIKMIQNAAESLAEKLTKTIQEKLP